MKILIACEHSGIVRKAFEEKGHNAWSCDLLPTEENTHKHIQDDIIVWLNNKWDMLIAFPPCTYLCSSGMHWTTRGLRSPLLTEKALHFVKQLMEAPIEKIAIENPVGCISTRIRKPDQYIQPYEFGEDASKKTCLWLKNLPPLQPTKYIKPRIINGKMRWSNQTDSGQNRLGPSEDRWKKRSKTYSGFAKAMADCWG